MGKRRKTYKEKIIADLRRKLYRQDSQKPFALEAKEPKITNNMPFHTQVSTVSISPHPYLTKDIFKTGVLTGTIVLLQIILYFLLKNHILTLPMVKY